MRRVPETPRDDSYITATTVTTKMMTSTTTIGMPMMVHRMVLLMTLKPLPPPIRSQSSLLHVSRFRLSLDGRRSISTTTNGAFSNNNQGGRGDTSSSMTSTTETTATDRYYHVVMNHIHPHQQQFRHGSRSMTTTGSVTDGISSSSSSSSLSSRYMTQTRSMTTTTTTTNATSTTTTATTLVPPPLVVGVTTTTVDVPNDEHVNVFETEPVPVPPQRDIMMYDVCIVGGGPAGLAAAIRIKQLCQQYPNHKQVSVCIIDKGSEIGSHIISGNVFDPIAINELFPEKRTNSSMTKDDGDDTTTTTNGKTWVDELRDMTGSIATPVTKDEFNVLYNATSSITVPSVLLPNQLHNTGTNYIISLSQLCRYLAQVAEQEYGVEIYPGFAASEVLTIHNDTGSSNNNTTTGATTAAVIGIATRDVGVAKDGTTHKSTYTRGVEIHAKQTLFAEGARGSCSEYLINTFQLRNNDPTNSNNDKTTANRKSSPSYNPTKHEFGHAQTYGLGIKEVWQVPSEQFQSGLVQHSIGFPLQSSLFDKNYGGSFLYHQDPDLVLIGYVVGLDYANPYLNPYKEFQKWKTHPSVTKHIQNGTCISYGARVLNEGGYHSIPNQLSVPGGTLIGCSAGFLNAVKIKGTHTAMKSGMLAAEATYKALMDDGVPSVAETDDGTFDVMTYPYAELVEYTAALRQSWIYKELYEVRNAHAAFSKWGIGGGLVYTAFATHISKGREPWTLHNSHHTNDSNATQPAKEYQPIDYPPADNTITFDLLTNLQRSNTYHEEDQPCHLRIKPSHASVPSTISLPTYAGPEQRFCPAGVYEYVMTKTTTDPVVVTTIAATTTTIPVEHQQHEERQLVINGQNCIHCKCCSIKMPQEYIEWTVPEGGGGPQYQVM